MRDELLQHIADVKKLFVESKEAAAAAAAASASARTSASPRKRKHYLFSLDEKRAVAGMRVAPDVLTAERIFIDDFVERIDACADLNAFLSKQPVVWGSAYTSGDSSNVVERYASAVWKATSWEAKQSAEMEHNRQRRLYQCWLYMRSESAKRRSSRTTRMLAMLNSSTSSNADKQPVDRVPKNTAVGGTVVVDTKQPLRQRITEEKKKKTPPLRRTVGGKQPRQFAELPSSPSMMPDLPGTPPAKQPTSPIRSIGDLLDTPVAPSVYTGRTFSSHS